MICFLYKKPLKDIWSTTARLCVIVVLFFLPAFITAQDAIIQWTQQYPAARTKKERKVEGKSFLNTLFGLDEAAQLVKPVALAVQGNDTIIAIDQGNGHLFRIRKKKGDVSPIKNRQYKSFESLVGICAIPGDKYLFTDSYRNRIFMFSPGQKSIMPLNDSLKLDRPTGIAWSPVKNEIWVVETNAHRISVLDMNGNLSRTIGTRGTGPGEFNFPTSIWIDKNGTAYVVDAMNFRIQIFDKDGNPARMFGSIGDASGYFARPKGIATDSKGNIYIADALFNTVQIFDQSGRFLFNFGTQGQKEGEFWMPAGLFIDNLDNIYVADTYNSRIQVFHNNYTNKR